MKPGEYLTVKFFVSVSLLVSLVACGGGESAVSSNQNSTPEQSLISWNGNAAGTWIYLTNGIIAFLADTKQIYDYDTKTVGAMLVNSQAQITNTDGTLVGATVTLSTNGLGTQSAIVRCNNGSQAALGYSYSRPYVDCSSATSNSTWGNGTSDSQATQGTSTGSGYQWQRTNSANQCVSLDSTSNSLTHFIVNSCNTDISVTWYDSGYCSTGCGSNVKANTKATITKIQSQWVFASCVLPGTPYSSPGITWKGSGAFYCLY